MTFIICIFTLNIFLILSTLGLFFFLLDASRFDFSVFVGVVGYQKLDMGKYVWFYSCSGETKVQSGHYRFTHYYSDSVMI